MSLRRKLLLVLLLTAVLPMLAVRGVQAVSNYKLQERIAQDMRTRLTHQAERAMLQTVAGYAHSLDQETKLAFAMLRAQATAVERRLDGPVPADPPRVPTVRAFAGLEAEDPVVWEVVLSDRHAVYSQAGAFEPLAISYKTQVVLPTGRARLNDGAARDQVAKLADMSGVYREIHEAAGGVILWQYTSLGSGLHFSYPGKSGFPPRLFAPAAWLVPGGDQLGQTDRHAPVHRRLDAPVDRHLRPAGRKPPRPDGGRDGDRPAGQPVAGPGPAQHRLVAGRDAQGRRRLPASAAE